MYAQLINSYSNPIVDPMSKNDYSTFYTNILISGIAQKIPTSVDIPKVGNILAPLAPLSPILDVFNIDPLITPDSKIYTADGAACDNTGIFPMLQRKLKNIFVNIVDIPTNNRFLSQTCDILDMEYIFGTEKKFLYGNAIAGNNTGKFLNIGKDFYDFYNKERLARSVGNKLSKSISKTPSISNPFLDTIFQSSQFIENTNVSDKSYTINSVFNYNELSLLWNIIYNNYVNYGVSLATYVHTFNPDSQCQQVYGFDDPFYGNYKNRTTQISNPQYYPCVTWNILSIPQGTYTTTFTTPPTLQQSAFWNNLYKYGVSGPWSIYSQLIQTNSFPYYPNQDLQLTTSEINALSYYTSSLSDYYMVPFIQNNYEPYNLFLTSTYFISTPYFYEQSISNTGNRIVNYSSTYSSINGTYCPLYNNTTTGSQGAYFIGCSTSTTSKLLVIQTLSQNNWSIIGNITPVNSSGGTINISSLKTSCTGNIYMTGLVSGNTTTPFYYFNNSSYSSINSTSIPGSNCVVPPSMMLVSYNQNKAYPAYEMIYLGTGQTSGTTTSNLWYSYNGGVSFNAINPTGQGITAPFNSYPSQVNKIVQTCKTYNPTTNFGYFQYAVWTTSSTTNSITFCTEPFGYLGPIGPSGYTAPTTGYTISNPMIYNITLSSGSQVIGVEYCPTISMLVVVLNTSSKLAINLYDCTTSPNLAVNTATTPIQYIIPSTQVLLSTGGSISISSLTNYGVKYVGKQLFIWLNNNIYSLTNILYNGTTPTSLTLTLLSSSNKSNNIINII
jgi:hypothetical protein